MSKIVGVFFGIDDGKGVICEIIEDKISLKTSWERWKIKVFDES
ncbi:10338_t:CDS:2 [Cetraspora pellucida]|uniref:10338_t:CDS:1 n=1 Tax=Cetraspora pellucida TaxID=1433469 RepID=A0A9N8VT60_9GLOM|nr:10338_t:CDS:2 [Cetraspora pellucida]